MEAVLFYLGILLLEMCLEVKGRSLNNLIMNQITNPEEYLRKFGYMAKTDPNNEKPLNSGMDLSQSLMRFQQWNNLPVTGELDSATQKLMSRSRCGVPDLRIEPEMANGFVLGPKWSKNKLTYRINNFSPDLSTAVIWTELARAFKFWTDVANIEISETSGTSDITVLFATGDHGDTSPFDGQGGVLAHATFPEGGQCHFDDDELWVSNMTGSDLFIIAAHEIGHVLGLDHSNSSSALMYPFYGGYIPNYTINEDDRLAIIAHYGEATPVSTTQSPTIGITTTSTESSTTIVTTTTTTTTSSMAAITVVPTIQIICCIIICLLMGFMNNAL